MPSCPASTGHSSSAEVTGHVVRLHFRSPSSPRHGDEAPAARDVMVGREMVCGRCFEFEQAFVDRSRRGLSAAGDKWQPNEVAARGAGKRHRLQRTVDRDGVMPDIFV